jgi:hypothetical protein
VQRLLQEPKSQCDYSQEPRGSGGSTERVSDYSESEVDIYRQGGEHADYRMMLRQGLQEPCERILKKC